MELRFIESFSKFFNAFRVAFALHFAVMALELPPGESRAASDAATRLASRASTRRGVASPQVGRKIFGLKILPKEERRDIFSLRRGTFGRWLMLPGQSKQLSLVAVGFQRTSMIGGSILSLRN